MRPNTDYTYCAGYDVSFPRQCPTCRRNIALYQCAPGENYYFLKPTTLAAVCRLYAPIKAETGGAQS